MDALIASLPILMVVVAMLGFGLPAKVALPIGWLATLVVALGYWGRTPSRPSRGRQTASSNRLAR